MKIDRLLGVVTYLLNRGTVPAKELAERFEVSVRTIVRDIGALSAAGIPISSSTGVSGGYSVMKGYKLESQIMDTAEQTAVVAALKGLSVSYEGSRYAGLLEKVLSIFQERSKQHIFLDFGASGENASVQEKLKVLDHSIKNRIAVKICYVNVSGEKSERAVEPLALNYRWYAWYLLAFCTKKQDYRIFKLPRIESIESAEIPFSREHEDPELLLESAFSGAGRRIPDIILRVRPSIKTAVSEYLRAEQTGILENGDLLMCFDVYENERMWFAMLLSFGKEVEVIAPEEVKLKLKKTAENILSLYN